MVSSGFIGIITRMQQIEFNNECSNEFMIISLTGSFLFLLVMAIIKERKKLSEVLKRGSFYGIAAGLCNGGKNFVNLFIYLYIPISIASPIRSALSLIVSFVISVLIYKEKFTRQQLFGAFLGIVSMILLKL